MSAAGVDNISRETRDVQGNNDHENADLRDADPPVLPHAAHRRLRAAVDGEPWLADIWRRVQHYGYRYDYTRRSVDPSQCLGPLPAWAQPVAERLVADGAMSGPPDQMIVNDPTVMYTRAARVAEVMLEKKVMVGSSSSGEEYPGSVLQWIMQLTCRTVDPITRGQTSGGRLQSMAEPVGVDLRAAAR